MSHFGDEEWADLARDEGDERRARMQQHLDEGCEVCSRALRLWKAVSRLAGQEASYCPPDSAVRQVRGQYALHKPRSFLKRAAHAASLLFDSSREPLPAGVRAAGTSSSRHLLYGAGGRLLKLRVESQGDSECLSLVGQVVEESDPERKLPNLPVLVQNGDKTVTRTLTNGLGEFELELEPAMSLRLVVGIPGPEALMVLLPMVAGGRDLGKSGSKNDCADESLV